jgi:hypothetical protein
VEPSHPILSPKKETQRKIQSLHTQWSHPNTPAMDGKVDKKINKNKKLDGLVKKTCRLDRMCLACWSHCSLGFEEMLEELHSSQKLPDKNLSTKLNYRHKLQHITTRKLSNEKTRFKSLAFSLPS